VKQVHHHFVSCKFSDRPRPGSAARPNQNASDFARERTAAKPAFPHSVMKKLPAIIALAAATVSSHAAEKSLKDIVLKTGK
jgi:hypothetical protein